jgi:glycosyltransferase involved in cell wall biosynthesis
MAVTHTFVLPVHNVQHDLLHSVETILDDLGDRYPEFELLIIDDGSTDDTRDVARDLLALFPQVRLIERPTQYGLDAAIQIALRNARGQQVSIAVTPGDLSRVRFRRIESARTPEGIAPHFRPRRVNRCDR